ncbi:MAG: proline--tRNA ligase [Candidatus Altiarchaeales archaeon]|nr:proline--tRNA ligase [Candidatus Altiarchaeales archaeon]MBD3417107.1 proline--tRNA ligase [Candidatus Altiarchaeales archaeon]
MEEDFGEWYRRMLSENMLVDDRYDVKGMLVYRGAGMRIIKQMSRYLEDLLEEDGHEPTLFPLLIPETLLDMEKEHIAGFEDEVYWVTHAGGNPVERRLALRPTSETCMYPMFALWTRTFADLPIKVHQTTTVYRNDTKQTRPLIRTREILWNEGHTAFATREEALQNIETITRIYTELITGLCCVPVQVNRRPDWDKFPGAEYTIAFDAIMPDGKTLQVATIHNLGQHFSNVFKIQFDDEGGNKKLAWQTSYGPGFGRLLASVVSVHGDGKGMVLPPRLASVQAVIIPIVFKDADKGKVTDYVQKVVEKLKSSGISYKVDDGDDRPGAKYYKWELRGVPVRLEVGPRDVEKDAVMVVRRDTGEKQSVKLKDLDLQKTFKGMEENIRSKARENFDSRIFTADTLADLEENLGEGIVTVSWCEKNECAKPLEEKGTILSILDDEGECIVCGKKGKQVRMAKTY